MANFQAIESRLGTNFLPSQEKIFAAIARPISESRVLILGQDPYPHPKDAMGLAFSIPASEPKLPPTLRNVFIELRNDLGGELRLSGDLSDWRDQGVVLLNQTLTLEEGMSNSHKDYGWGAITRRIVEVLKPHLSAAILWGKSAQTFEPLLDPQRLITSVHPSPLSSYRGFFGSRPFSQVNQLLINDGRDPIIWTK